MLPTPPTMKNTCYVIKNKSDMVHVVKRKGQSKFQTLKICLQLKFL